MNHQHKVNKNQSNDSRVMIQKHECQFCLFKMQQDLQENCNGRFSFSPTSRDPTACTLLNIGQTTRVARRNARVCLHVKCSLLASTLTKTETGPPFSYRYTHKQPASVV